MHQGIVAGLDLLVFLDGAHVHAAKGANFAAQVGHLCAQGRQAFKLHAKVLCLTDRELVFIPQLCHSLVVLGLGSGLALCKAGHLAPHFLAAVGGSARPAQCRCFSLLAFQPLFRGFPDGLFFLGDLGLAVGLCLPDGCNFCPAALAALCQCRKAFFQRGAAGSGILCPLLQRCDLAVGQFCILLAGHLFQPLCAELLAQFGLLGHKVVVAFGNSVHLRRQQVDLCRQPGLQAGSFLCFATALCHGRLQSVDLLLAVAAGRFQLGGSSFQPLLLCLGTHFVVGGGDLFTGRGGQLCLKGIYLLFAAVGLFLCSKTVFL